MLTEAVYLLGQRCFLMERPDFLCCAIDLPLLRNWGWTDGWTDGGIDDGPTEPLVEAR